MVTYVEAANAALSHQLASHSRTVVLGQNVDAGSRLGGLSANFSSIRGCTIINSTNSENSLVGCGFGLMLRGVPSLLLLKQEDFLLLGVDQLVNTWNMVRGTAAHPPFVIGFLVVDSGWEGAQSGFNNTSTLGSLARIPWYTPSGLSEINLAVAAAFQGGPRMLALSQRLLREDLTGSHASTAYEAPGYVVYEFGIETQNPQRVLILSLNFSLPQCINFAMAKRAQGDAHVLLASAYEGPARLEGPIADQARIADEVWIVSDEKSASPGQSYELAYRVQLIRGGDSRAIRLIHRSDTEEWSRPNRDEFAIPGA